VGAAPARKELHILTRALSSGRTPLSGFIDCDGLGEGKRLRPCGADDGLDKVVGVDSGAELGRERGACSVLGRSRVGTDVLSDDGISTGCLLGITTGICPDSVNVFSLLGETLVAALGARDEDGFVGILVKDS
jgi:hypothetical protein